MRCLGGAFGGGVAPGAGAGGAEGADLEPVLGATDEAGDGAARGLADVALGPGSAGGGGLLGDVGLDAAFWLRNGPISHGKTWVLLRIPPISHGETRVSHGITRVSLGIPAIAHGKMAVSLGIPAV